jgi:hypothetical protein
MTLASPSFLCHKLGAMNKTDTAIMKQCIADLEGLMKENWDQISSMRDETEGRIKVGVAFLISFKGNEQAVKTTLTFGRRVSESRESIINPNQIDLPLNGDSVAQEAGEVESSQEPKKPRRKAAQEA